MKYEVTIKKIETVEAQGKKWTIIGQVSTTNQDASDAYNREKMPPMKDQYGYIDMPETKTVETEILKQVVEDIDLSSVIKAINKL